MNSNAAHNASLAAVTLETPFKYLAQYMPHSITLVFIFPHHIARGSN